MIRFTFLNIEIIKSMSTELSKCQFNMFAISLWKKSLRICKPFFMLLLRCWGFRSELLIKEKLFSWKSSTSYLFTSTAFTFNCWLFVRPIMWHTDIVVSFLSETVIWMIDLAIASGDSSDLKSLVPLCKIKWSGGSRKKGF